MTSIRSASVLLLAAACARPDAVAPVAVIVAPTAIVHSAPMAETLTVAGTVRSATISPLAAKVMGNVTRVWVSEGDRVRAGQLLLEIDDRDVRAQSDRARAGREAVSGAAESARAQAALAQTNFERYAALRQRGSVSQAEYDAAQAAAKVAEAELQRALAQQREAGAAVEQAGVVEGFTKIHAPIDGIVTARLVDPGAQAAPGMPLLTIEAQDHFRVETTLPDDLASAVHAGDAVTVEANGRRYELGVTQIVAAVDPMSRSALVKIDLPRDAVVRSGAFARVAFVVGQRSGVAVPLAAVQRHGELANVYVVGSDNVARLRLITTGETRGDTIEVLSGLDDGERIVILPPANLSDGMRVS
jgi:membrane fusion protein, multidrug efflux system